MTISSHAKPSPVCVLPLAFFFACVAFLSGCQDNGVVGKNTDALVNPNPDVSPITIDLDGGTAPSTPVDSAAPYDTAGVNEDVPQVPICGDGILQPGEACDDGNPIPGDGCSGVCTIEPGFVCPTPGQLCVAVVIQICGDGLVEGSEACDDGNDKSGDGCSGICTVESGWSCELPGQPCVPSVRIPAGLGRGFRTDLGTDSGVMRAHIPEASGR